jgi:hypothetical protein
MVAHPGQPLDHDGDAVKSPQLSREPVRGGAFQQGLFDRGELGIRQPWSGAAGSAAVYDIGTAGLPARAPAADGLGEDAELAGDPSLADTSGEQLCRAER